MRRLISLTVAALLLTMTVIAGAGCGREPVVIGVVPSPEVSNLSESMAPIAQAMAGALKREVVPRVYMSYGQLIEGLGDGECDTAIIPPFAYAVAHDLNGTNVVLSNVRAGKADLRYELLSRIDSGISLPAMMPGATIAIPAAAGTPEQQYLTTFLKRFGAADKVVSLADDQAAVNALLGRSADVVAVTYGYRDSIRPTIPDIDARVQVVWISDRIPLDAVVVAQQANASPTEISQAWLELSGQEAFKPALRAVFGVDGLVPATDADYAPAREAVQTLGIKIR